MRKLFLLLLCLSFSIVKAQDYFPTDKGVKTSEKKMFALTNATIYVTPTEVIKKGTLLIKDGKVVEVGKSVKIPKGTITTDLDGKSIYPSFIDIYTEFGLPKPKRAPRGRVTQYEPSREGYYWNDHIRPDTNPIENFKFDNRKAKAEF